MALELGVVGLMNVQFAVKGEDVYVLEVNPRASRTVPFVSKCIGTSLAKVAAANALHASADVALQLLGAKGYSKDTVVEWIYRYARQARLVDGADEVHRMVVANFLRKERDGFFAWGHHG